MTEVPVQIRPKHLRGTDDPEFAYRQWNRELVYVDIEDRDIPAVVWRWDLARGASL